MNIASETLRKVDKFAKIGRAKKILSGYCKFDWHAACKWMTTEICNACHFDRTRNWFQFKF